jgi:phospholipase C
VGERGGLSRREFLVGATSAAASLALSGCGGASPSSSAPTISPRRRYGGSRLAGQRPDLSRPPGTDLIPQIEHIIVVMQENHSYDSYFGMLGRGDGFTLDEHGKPTATNPDGHGHAIRAYRMANTCQSRSPSQNWNAMHLQWNNGAMDGFVRSPSGAAAMGYWDGADLPFYYGLASTFPVCDRWFASSFGQTYPNRRFLLCGSALGSISTISQSDLPQPRNGTIVEALNRHDISWRDYYTTLPSLGLFLPVLGANLDKVQKIDRFFADAAAGQLPSFCLVESDTTTQTEEDPQDISLGEAFVARVINTVMRGPNWATTVLVLCYDEHGGYYDHVPPPPAVPPDDIAPILQAHPGEHLDGLPENVPGDYARYGFRVPAVIVSPYARKNYVSHVVHDHTSILSLIEHKWNLPALTNRDGDADNLLDSLTLSGSPPYRTPPPLPAPRNTTASRLCRPGQPGPIPNPQG